jgi:hypothetical protein
LNAVRPAVTDGVKLLVIERLLVRDSGSAEGHLADLHMMVVTGGRERTRDEMTTLLNRSGFVVSNLTALSGDRFIIEAQPAEGSR